MEVVEGEIIYNVMMEKGLICMCQSFFWRTVLKMHIMSDLLAKAMAVYI